jgi:NAD(P)-dependent dehydrogenase (short-subunit alcohol dehydrogenase family)
MMKSVAFGARSTADQVLAGIDLSGKRFVVTGCNSGMGFETMSALAANGAEVIGLARTLQSAQRACRDVAFNCVAMECDLSDFDSIAAAASAICRLPGTIDGIVANAGIARLASLHTRYGVELQFLVNSIGHFALINGLTKHMRDGSGRVVLLSSDASVRQAPAAGVMFDNLAGQRFYDPAIFYGQSKLANALYAGELARRLRGRGIAVNTADPGAVRGTRLMQHLGWPLRWLHALASPFKKSAAQGAATAVLLAASPSTSGVSGEYWTDCQPAQGSPLLEDFALAARLWDLSEQVISRHAATLDDTAPPTGIHRAA